jgi:hypothetical protein
MKIEFTCIEARGSDSGQRVRLVVPLPPPLPVVDGYGNPVAHPPPPSGVLTMFVTSPERQAILSQIDPLARKAKVLRPEIAVDKSHAAELLADKAKLQKQIDSLRSALSSVTGELKFEHGQRYVLTIEKAPKVKP